MGFQGSSPFHAGKDARYPKYYYNAYDLIVHYFIYAAKCGVVVIYYRLGLIRQLL